MAVGAGLHLAERHEHVASKRARAGRASHCHDDTCAALIDLNRRPADTGPQMTAIDRKQEPEA